MFGLLALVRPPPCLETLQASGNLILESCIWVTSGRRHLPAATTSQRMIWMAWALGRRGVIVCAL